MIFDASTSFASTFRSAGVSADTSALMSVGAKRAAICCRFAVWGTGDSSKATSGTVINAASAAIVNFDIMGLV